MNISIKIQNTLSSIILQTLPHKNNPTMSQFRTPVVQHECGARSHNSDRAVCTVSQVELSHHILIVTGAWGSNHQYVITA